MKTIIHDPADRRSYLAIGHGTSSHVWIWTGSRIESQPSNKTHAEIWGRPSERQYRGRWDGVRLSIITPAETVRSCAPQWLLDALEAAFGTPTEVLLF